MLTLIYLSQIFNQKVGRVSIRDHLYKARKGKSRAKMLYTAIKNLNSELIIPKKLVDSMIKLKSNIRITMARRTSTQLPLLAMLPIKTMRVRSTKKRPYHQMTFKQRVILALETKSSSSNLRSKDPCSFQHHSRIIKISQHPRCREANLVCRMRKKSYHYLKVTLKSITIQIWGSICTR